MSQGAKIRHLHRIAKLVNKLQTYLDEHGLGDATTKQKLVEIRMALIDEVEDDLVAPRPRSAGFASGHTPNPA